MGVKRYSILAPLCGLSILAVALVTVQTVFPATGANHLPSYFFEAVRPFVYNAEFFYMALALGFCAGMATGHLGLGGGALVVPGLMTFGVRGIMAVASDIFYSFSITALGMFLFKNRGGLHPKLIMVTAPTAIAGAAVGAFLNRSVYLASPRLSELVITLASCTFLGLLAAYFILGYLKQKKELAEQETAQEHDEENPDAGPEPQSKDMDEEYAASEKKPLIEVDGKAISPVKAGLAGFLAGLAMALAGSGGGLISLPLLTGLAKLPEFIVLGSDMAQGFLVNATVGVGFYSSWGFVVYTIAAGLVLGSIPGLTIGFLSGVAGPDPHTKGVVGISLACLSLNRALALPEAAAILLESRMSATVGSLLSGLGKILLLLSLAGLCVWILFRLFKEISKLRRNHPLDMIPNGKNILVGCSLGLVCLAVSFFFLFGLQNSRSGLNRLNTASNAIVKKEVNNLNRLQRANQPYMGTMFKLALVLPSNTIAEKTGFILNRLGVQITVRKTTLHLLGDFGYMVSNMLAACSAVYDNDDIGIRKLLGMPAQNALNELRRVILDLEKAFAANGQPEQAKILTELIPLALYPAYNFYKIPVDEPGTGLNIFLWAPLLFLAMATMSGMALSMLFTGFGFSFTPAPETWKPLTDGELAKMRKERKALKTKGKKKRKKKKRPRPKGESGETEQAAGSTPQDKDKKPVRKKRKKAPKKKTGSEDEEPLKKKRPLKKKPKPKKEADGISLDEAGSKTKRPKKKPVKKKTKKKSGDDSMNLDF